MKYTTLRPMKLAITASILVSFFSSSVALAICSPKIQKTRPDSRYEDLDSEIKDKKTGLVWKRCSLGQTWNGVTCTGQPTAYTWRKALVKANAVGSGYRLPNIKELQSLVEDACYGPAINRNMFPNTSNATYWSSSPYNKEDSRVWYVFFHDGYTGFYDKNDKKYVRVVRDGY